MILKGTPIKYDEDTRLFTLKTSDKEYLIHLTIKEFKDLHPYIESNKIEMIIDCSEPSLKNFKGDEQKEVCIFNHFEKITSLDGKTVYYDIRDIRHQVRDFLNGLHYKMFLDLEFSWPVPYTHMPTEILQYGYIITDENDKIVEKKSGLIKPTRASSLNKRTLKFLGKKKEDFENGEPYISFYQDLERIVKNYDIKIIAWGRNDYLQIEKSFKLNHLARIDVRSKFINIMQVIKNYYCLKTEIGLFKTYERLTNQEYHEQTHDALEDAMLAKEIFEIFRNKINEEK